MGMTSKKIWFSIGLFIILFLMYSFINLSINPNDWSETERFFMGLVWVCGSVFWAAYIEDINKK